MNLKNILKNIIVYEEIEKKNKIKSDLEDPNQIES
jgi:hypothetical protein